MINWNLTHFPLKNNLTSSFLLSLASDGWWVAFESGAALAAEISVLVDADGLRAAVVEALGALVDVLTKCMSKNVILMLI